MSVTTILFILVGVALIAGKAGKAVKKAFPVPSGDVTATHYDEDTMTDEGMMADVHGNEYFSYENMPGDSCFTDSEATKTAMQGVDSDGVQKEGMSVSALSEFNLQHAVIYSAILHNDYIESRQ